MEIRAPAIEIPQESRGASAEESSKGWVARVAAARLLFANEDNG
ncbi:MAG: hypothetical protein ACREP6_07470 [Candidatus Binataceae bacterium]